MTKVTAVVPVRAGSQRVPDKNLRPWGGSCLLLNKLRTLLQVAEIDEIVENTDSERALELVRGITWGGGRVKTHTREAYYASSRCSGSEFFEHLGRVTPTDVFVYAPCTSPFIEPATIAACLALYNDKAPGGCDCVSTVSPVKEFLWRSAPDGYEPLNYDPTNAPNSQDLPDVVRLNFGCTVTSRDSLLRNRNIIGKHPLFVPTGPVEAVDIDTPLDFYLSSQLALKRLRDGDQLLE